MQFQTATCGILPLFFFRILLSVTNQQVIMPHKGYYPQRLTLQVQHCLNHTNMSYSSIAHTAYSFICLGCKSTFVDVYILHNSVRRVFMWAKRAHKLVCLSYISRSAPSSEIYIYIHVFVFEPIWSWESFSSMGAMCRLLVWTWPNDMDSQNHHRSLRRERTSEIEREQLAGRLLQ